MNIWPYIWAVATVVAMILLLRVLGNQVERERRRREQEEEVGSG